MEENSRRTQNMDLFHSPLTAVTDVTVLPVFELQIKSFIYLF